MKTSSPAARLIQIGFLIGCAALLIWNQNAITKLTAANQDLLAESQEAKKLARENQEIARLRLLVRETEELREGIRDLPKLRNEVRVQRERFAELKAVHAQNERLSLHLIEGNQSRSPVQPEGFVPVAGLVDAGLGSPRATVQTYFWAMSRGNVARMYECSDRKHPFGHHRNGVPFSEQELADSTEEKRQKMIEEMESFPGYRIAEEKVISPEEVELALQSAVGGVVLNMTLKRVGNEWKLKP